MRGDDTCLGVILLVVHDLRRHVVRRADLRGGQLHGVPQHPRHAEVAHLAQAGRRQEHILHAHLSQQSATRRGDV